MGASSSQSYDKDSVQQTLCIPLWGRKIASEQFPDLFPDPDAARIVKELGVDFSDKKLYKVQYSWLNCVIRQYNMGWEINNYLKKHPKAVIVEMGAGLSSLRRQLKNDTNPWYCIDMPDVIEMRKQLIPQGEHEKNIVCDLNDFSWFNEIDFRPEDGIVFIGAGLFYYFEKKDVHNLFCAMAEHFPGGLLVFDATNKMGLKGVNAEIKATGNESKSFFSLEHSKQELEAWSDKIINVSEKDYITGYLKNGDGYRQSLMTRFLSFFNKAFHLAFIVHAEFRK